jgi:hypothetical protein
MSRELSGQSPADRQAAPVSGAGRTSLVRAALNYLRRGLPPDGRAPETTVISRQKIDLCEWAKGLGLLLSRHQLPPVALRGGQEHDLYHDKKTDRYIKVTRDGVFGLSPGIDLALVSSSHGGRKFHLWEATPLEYLERLELHNQLVPDLNVLEGVFVQADGDMAIVTSQPRFDIVPVTETEIDDWFLSQGFHKITHSAYYREADNLGVFDAHDKNVIRAGEILIPFDIIPCRPAAGFLEFIEDTLKAGHTLTAQRTVTTSSRRQ